MININETTVYKNELNMIPMRKFNAVEMDLFFAICTKMKNMQLETIRFDFEDLKTLSNYSHRSLTRFVDDLEHVYDKMLHLTYCERSGLSFKKFILFTGYEVNAEEQFVEISINPKLDHILNNLSHEFTKFEFEEFTLLNSSYSKTLFRLLKQFRLTGYFKIHIDDFRERFDIPKTYQMNDITKRVLSPASQELKDVFRNLTIKKLKARKGNKIEHLVFQFTPESKEITSNNGQNTHEDQSNTELHDAKAHYEQMLAERRQKKSSQS